MMGRHIIHIGYHKTATTWFQRIYYPHVENLTYVHRKKVRKAFLSDSAFKFNPDKALSILGKSSSGRLILCEEELSGNIHSGGLFGYLSKEIGTRLKLTLPNSQVVIFIRNQLDMLGSVYKQYVEEGGTHSVTRYLHPHRYLSSSGFSPMKVPLFSFDHFEYHPLIQHYEALFGRENIFVFLYEDFSQNPEDFMARYRNLFDLRVDHNQISFEKVNISYKPIVLPIARFLNRFTYQNVVDKRYLVHIPVVIRTCGKLLKSLNKFDLLSSTSSLSELLGEENIQFILDRFRTSNQRLILDYNLPLKQYAYPC
jgi:hypothetical protein